MTASRQSQIVLVEDSDDAVVILRFLLEREGYCVVHASDGKQAQELISSMPPPALVILDVMLPFMSGLQLIRLIRDKKEWSSVPVLMLTSDEAERDVLDAFAHGAKDYVKKPYNPRELLARIRNLLTSAAAS